MSWLEFASESWPDVRRMGVGTVGTTHPPPTRCRDVDVPVGRRGRAWSSGVVLVLSLSPGLALSQAVATTTTTTVTPVLVSEGAPSVPLEALPERFEPYDPRADRTGTPILPPRTATVGPTSAPPGERRPVPDYDGREPAGMTAREALVWVPRVLLYPAHLVMEYAVRWPLVEFITWQEREKILARVSRVFTFRGGQSGLFPTAFFDFGLLPSVGFYFYNEDLFVEGHDFAVQGGFWANDWRRIVVDDRVAVFDDDTGQLHLHLEYATRPDHPYYGVGYATNQSALTYFEHRVLDAHLGLGASLGGLNRISGFVRYRNAELGPGQGPSLETRFDTTRVDGFRDGGYQLLTSGVRLELDTRAEDRGFTDGSGLRAELSSDFSVDPDEPDRNFLRWGVQASAFLDVTGKNHVLGLQVYTAFVERTGEGEVPPTELIVGGGEEVLRGFLRGRFRGDSLFAATLNYRYPIWILLDADFFFGVGNAFGPQLEGFTWKRLVLEGGFALRTSLSRETSLDLLVGFGTNRLEEDLRVDNVRFTFGANHGF